MQNRALLFLGHYGSLWVIFAHDGSFWLIPCFSTTGYSSQGKYFLKSQGKRYCFLVKSHGKVILLEGKSEKKIPSYHSEPWVSWSPHKLMNSTVYLIKTLLKIVIILRGLMTNIVYTYAVGVPNATWSTFGPKSESHRPQFSDWLLIK